MSTAAHRLSNDFLSWNGEPLADGTKIVLQAIGRFNNGRLEDHGPAWITLKSAGANAEPSVETYVVAETESAQPHVFTVRTLPERPGECLTAPDSPAVFQKLILLGRNGRYLDNERVLRSTKVEKDLFNAEILILDLTQQGRARLMRTPWAYKDRDMLPQRIDVYTLRCEFPRCDTTVLESVSFTAPTRADLFNLKIVPPSLTLLQDINVTRANMTGMVMNEDGSRLYAHNSGEFYVIDTAANTSSLPAEIGINSTGLALSPDGSRAYMTHSMLQLSVIDTTTRAEIRRVPLGQVSGVTVAPDGKVYVADSYFGNLWKLDRNGTVLGQMQVASTGIEGPLADPTNPGRVFVMIEDEKSIGVVDTATNSVIRKIDLAPVQADEGMSMGQMVISPDGKYLCVVQHPQYITLINTSTYAVEPPIRLGTPIQRVAFSSDGYSVFVSYPDLVLTVRRDTREIVSQLAGLRGATQVIAHPNNQLLYISNRSAATISVVEAM